MKAFMKTNLKVLYPMQKKLLLASYLGLILDVSQKEDTEIDYGEILKDLQWEASTDAAALENRLKDEIFTLETVYIHEIYSLGKYPGNYCE